MIPQPPTLEPRINSSLLFTRSDGTQEFVHDNLRDFFLALYAVINELDVSEIVDTVRNTQFYFFYTQLTSSPEPIVEELFDRIPYMKFSAGLFELSALQECYKAAPALHYDFLETKYGLSTSYKLDDIISVLVWVPDYFDRRAKTDISALCSELDSLNGWNNSLNDESTNLFILSSVVQELQNHVQLPSEVEEYLSSFLDAEEVYPHLRGAPDIYAGVLDLMSKGSSEHSKNTLLSIATKFRPGWQKALGSLGERNDPTITPYVLDMLAERPTRETGKYIARALVSIGPTCIPYLEQYAGQGNPILEIFIGNIVEELRSDGN